jgi:hypothetical protein
VFPVSASPSLLGSVLVTRYREAPPCVPSDAKRALISPPVRIIGGSRRSGIHGARINHGQRARRSLARQSLAGVRYNGLAEMSVEILVERLDNMEEIYRVHRKLVFPDRLRDMRFAARIREAAIFARLWESAASPEQVKQILRLGFFERDQARMHELAAKNQRDSRSGAKAPRADDAWQSRVFLLARQSAQGKTNDEIKTLLAQQIAVKGQRGLVPTTLLPTAPAKMKHLVDPYDKTQDLTTRVRSYLHSNCAQCDIEAGGGNSAMELEFTKPLDKMRIIDVKPLHDTFGIKDARLIAPGDPDRSVLLKRISHRDKGHMPPLTTRVVDQPMVDAMREWIAGMKK